MKGSIHTLIMQSGEGRSGLFKGKIFTVLRVLEVREKSSNGFGGKRGDIYDDRLIWVTH